MVATAAGCGATTAGLSLHKLLAPIPLRIEQRGEIAVINPRSSRSSHSRLGVIRHAQPRRLYHRQIIGAVADLGLSHDDVLAVGDGANDLAMLGRAGLGVAFHAKPIVADAARARIDHGDLTALLYLQGYRDDEIVRP